MLKNLHHIFFRTIISAIMLMTSSKVFSQPCTGTITTFPYLADFEATPGNWTTGGTLSDWEWGTPAKTFITGAGSGQKCWITGGLNKPSYNQNQKSWLMSPCFDFSTLIEPELSMKIFWDTQREYDGAVLQYSLDNGASWIFIGIYENTVVSCEKENWFNANSLFDMYGWRGWAGNTKPNNGTCVGGGGSGSWLNARHLIHFLGGEPSVRFRFFFGTGTSCSTYDGFAFDDFSIHESPANTINITSTCRSSNQVTFNYASDCATSYAWNFGDPGSGSNTASGSSPTHTFSAPGIYTVTLNSTFEFGSPGTGTKEVVIIGGTKDIQWPGACTNVADAVIKVIPSGSPYPYTYSWNTSPIQTSQSISNVGTGDYNATVNTQNGCPASFRFSLENSTPISISSVVTGARCNGANGSVETTIEGGREPLQFLWSNGQTTPSLSNIPGGNYSLKITDENGCVKEHTALPVTDLVYNVPVDLGPDLQTCPGQTVVLKAGVFNGYLWQDGSTRPTFSVNRSGKYFVTVQDQFGCKGSDTVNILAECENIYFPTIFSPNRDGINDDFGPLGNLPALTNYYIDIYDRYGNRLFYSTDPYLKWNGKYKNGYPDQGTYVWVSGFTLKGKREKHKGSVILAR